MKLWSSAQQKTFERCCHRQVIRPPIYHYFFKTTSLITNTAMDYGWTQDKNGLEFLDLSLLVLAMTFHSALDDRQLHVQYRQGLPCQRLTTVATETLDGMTSLEKNGIRMDPSLNHAQQELARHHIIYLLTLQFFFCFTSTCYEVNKLPEKNEQSAVTPYISERC